MSEPRSPGHFEPLHHRTLDGEVVSVPVFIGEADSRLPFESEALLRAAEVIVSGLETTSLAELIGKVTAVKAASYETNELLIEDPKGHATVIVGSEMTTVAVQEQGAFLASTALLLDMLTAWQEYQDSPS